MLTFALTKAVVSTQSTGPRKKTTSEHHTFMRACIHLFIFCILTLPYLYNSSDTLAGKPHLTFRNSFLAISNKKGWGDGKYSLHHLYSVLEMNIDEGNQEQYSLHSELLFHTNNTNLIYLNHKGNLLANLFTTCPKIYPKNRLNNNLLSADIHCYSSITLTYEVVNKTILNSKYQYHKNCLVTQTEQTIRLHSTSRQEPSKNHPRTYYPSSSTMT
eukprot:TRINITY_DN2475_c0_g1_i6.p1 TRINITY_DN2475_c0_g1~~TRINITY_DN2475_c0_g1_i6.p1  ORF type:complete len:215 (+),score=-1.07 TRINITY_DN2475_c0_g1_i6:281-925(+)